MKLQAITLWLLISFGIEVEKNPTDPASVVVIFCAAMPVLLAAMHDVKSVWLMLTRVRCCVHLVCADPSGCEFQGVFFLLFQATQVLYVCGTYAFSRAWELVWGNRPEGKSTVR